MQAFLDKYDVKLDNAILAEEKHVPVYQDLKDNHKPLFIAGGATQNTARVAQWQVNEPGAVTYAGCIGKDEFGARMKEECTKDGLTTLYKECDSATGTCAVLVKGGERSLIANLSAAEKYTIDHTESAPVQAAIKAAGVYYIAGFVLTHSADSIMHVANHACDNDKVMCMNAAAPFLFQVPPFFEAFKNVWPLLDIVFGNEGEAAEMGKAFGLAETSVKDIAVKIQAMPKKGKRARMVVFTQGSTATIVADDKGVTEYPVPKCEKLVDTNGAGDAFCGGFLAAFMQGKATKECVECGHYTAGVVIQRSSCQYADAERYKF
jgi:adenosine kinase